MTPLDKVTGTSREGMSMELVRFISQDSTHFVGALFVGWLLFSGIEAIVKAWRGRE
jgi:hypothetical protein